MPIHCDDRGAQFSEQNGYTIKVSSGRFRKHKPLVVQVLRSMAEQVSVLVHGAALDGQVFAPERNERSLQPRRTVNDYELGLVTGAYFRAAGVCRQTRS